MKEDEKQNPINQIARRAILFIVASATMVSRSRQAYGASRWAGDYPD